MGAVLSVRMRDNVHGADMVVIPSSQHCIPSGRGNARRWRRCGLWPGGGGHQLPEPPRCGGGVIPQLVEFPGGNVAVHNLPGDRCGRGIDLAADRFRQGAAGMEPAA